MQRNVNGLQMAWILLGPLLAAGYPQGLSKSFRNIPGGDDKTSVRMDKTDLEHDLAVLPISVFAKRPGIGCGSDCDRAKVNMRLETATLPMTSEYNDESSRGQDAEEWRPTAHPLHGKGTDLSVRQKRQQGWMTKYGKRQTEMEKLYDHFHIADIVSAAQKRQQGWMTKYGKRQVALRHPYDYIHRDDDFRDRAKRQQGWYTSYGKRSKDFDLLSDRLTRRLLANGRTLFGLSGEDDSASLQALEVGEGMNVLEVHDEGTVSEASQTLGQQKSQLAWHALGKRYPENVPTYYKRQQGWHTKYGKRSLRDSVRQEPAVSGYPFKTALLNSVDHVHPYMSRTYSPQDAKLGEGNEKHFVIASDQQKETNASY